MSDLKPCPFCGKVPVPCALRGVYCECMTEPLSPERWNNRSTECELIGKIAVLRAAIKNEVECAQFYLDSDPCCEDEESDARECIDRLNEALKSTEGV